MKSPDRRLLFVGHPDATEISEWTAVHATAVQSGWTTTRRFTPGGIAFAIASEDVLDGMCSATEAEVMQVVHDAGIRCMNAVDARAHLFTPDSTNEVPA
ncbi:MAG: hypothetical protein GXY65_16730 [Rhodococcus sp.]|uniref:hypothetical protein n=1 Tax=Rhodococcus sp. TaxID=1831 RepID=UPI0016B99B3A|nr:hypothetical protein [Rhodococcus sp. (in: high G+C Gram-positive bacteria)]NLV80951.1 hypothetical protein [Rhodococcus sp. (in: high G+C Gram-positive bacteria)]